ncbi:Enzyme that catalyzes the fourth step in the histidine pathway [Ascosphaera aggregata]|nr:Enzyme that catalyzes the fourth step in the histidine pathway [Ascosphaera aggregata]
MTKFRPCIDLHSGQVKQIVGGTLTSQEKDLRTNFVSTLSAGHYAELYRKHELRGGHVVMLGAGNDAAAKEALGSWPGGLHVAGGITDKNAQYWVDAGAEKVVVTSYLFPEGKFSLDRLQNVLSALGGDKSKLVIDLSCRRKNGSWFVAMNRWQTITEMEVNQGMWCLKSSTRLRYLVRIADNRLKKSSENIKMLEDYCSEFLIHAADVEGLQKGIDEELVSNLAKWCSIPVTYAGGGRNIQDLELVKNSSEGKVDLTIGSALDIFGGSGVTFTECIEWNKANQA